MATLQLAPQESLNGERFQDYEKSSVESPLIGHILDRVDQSDLHICDVGGATGVFLDHLFQRSEYDLAGTIVEVLPDYRQHLVNDAITYRHASILDNDIPSDAFDFVTARHVLHHLVGDSVATTRELQARGLAEMLRITKPGGFCMIHERIHFVESLSTIVFRLSLAASKSPFHCSYFEAGKVVVRFMTPAEIVGNVEAIGENCPLTIELNQATKRNVEWKWKLTWLMANVGDLCLIVKKH